MSGQWWESNLIVGPFANITEANAWAAANPSSLFPGLLATSNGQQIKWRGAGVGWVMESKTANGGVVHFVGDSITTRYNGMTWAHQVVTLSKGRYIVGVDAAVGGAKIQDAITVQVPKISAMVADEVWIQIGTNVSHASPVVSEEVALFDALIESIQDACPGAFVRVWGVPPSGLDDTMKRYMHAYNRALEAYCRDRGLFYAYGWDDVVDASGGLNTSMRLDATHPNYASHRLCAGRRIAAIYGAEPTSYQVQFTSSESGDGSVFTWDKGLMLTDTNADGIPDIYNNYTYPSASKLARLNDAVAPIFGKVYTREMVGATSSILDRIVTIALDPAKDYEVGFYYKQDCSQESGVRMTYKSADPGNIWAYVGGGGFDLEGYYRFTVPKELHLGTMNLDASHMASTYPVNMTVTYGMISIRPVM